MPDTHINTLTLSQEEQNSLKQALHALSARAKMNVSLEGLIADWDALARHVAHGYDGSIYEYANDLSSRTALETLMAAAPAALAKKIAARIARADAQFRAGTREATAPAQPGKPKTEWWFWRIPSACGDELRADLEAGGIKPA